MADMGIGNAYGAEGAAEALRQIIKDRLQQQQQQFENNRLTANDARAAEEHAMKMQDYRDALAQRAQGERDTAASKALPNLGIGGAVEAPDFAKTFAGTSSAPNFTPERTLPSTQMAGGMPLDPSQPSVQTTTEAPRQITGRMLSMGTDQQRTGEEQKQLRGQLISNPNLTDRERLMIGMENAGLKVPANMEAKPSKGAIHDTPNGLVRIGDDNSITPVVGPDNKPVQGYHPPVSTPGWTVQQGMVGGKPGWVRINSQTGEVRPVDPGEVTPKPSAQETEHTRTNKEALDTLAQLDQAIENAKDLIGPGAGRVSNLEQLAGSADPKIQALGVKMKAAKMRVDHAVTGSVRSGASPTLLAQWDNILANKVTPEGLKAGVQAMREIIGGGSGDAGGGLPTVGGTFQGGKVLKVEKVE